MKTSLKNEHQKELVLTKAILKLADFYNLTGKDLHSIIGVSESTITRLSQGKAFLSPTTKEGEIALLLLRVYRGLNSLLGNNHDKAKLWLNSHNNYFNQKPIEHLKTVTGLVDVVNYIDAMRGKL
ncbi:MbcA/ParS/Xre antitoxin family protein [Legionella saoudiensis]|uniref:MbcA/ParS/Xre antitoxin family protein n=1 Tax=Legionella saoudiensis TaxID=1750561 RepID=UPI0007315CDA|nr:antitoxin Xre/MbcA/ParS toxin-binding domain-containing protein [Legionella saoudiensis]